LLYFLEVPITIELPDLDTQTAFNLGRWSEILRDHALAKLPNRIETDRHGHIVMSPPPAFKHSRRQDRVIGLLHQLLPDGQTLPECPVSTADGVKAIDVAWLDGKRSENAQDPAVLAHAPEICIEILSPSNTAAEITEKRALYFDSGAVEVWICSVDGGFTFFVGPDDPQLNSVICSAFPDRIP
jgi:Uma2 family endonuclease